MVMKKEKRKIKRNNYRKSLVPTLKRSTTSDTTTTSVTDFLNLVLYEERNRSIYNKYVNPISNHSSSERILWISVFLQALLDATKEGYKGEPVSSAKNRTTAIKWFTLPDSAVTASTFEPICSLAGINVSYARNYFVKLLDGSEKLKFRRINSILNMKSLWRNK